MEENNYVVYRHTSPSGKVYIGITSLKPEKRWRNGEGYKGCYKFYNAIQKYGWDNIKHEIIFSGLNEDSAKLIEEIFIYYYKQQNISLNITDGGDGMKGYHHTEEAKKKISEAGKNPSEETRKKIGAAQKGKILSEETRKKIGASLKGHKVSEEHKKKLSKEVNQFSKDGSFITTYPSLNEAGRNTGIHIGHISECCIGRLKSAGGFVWKFKE